MCELRRRDVNPLVIGLVAGLLCLAMIVALGFLYRQHMRKQRRRAIVDELEDAMKERERGCALSSSSGGPTSSAPRSGARRPPPPPSRSSHGSVSSSSSTLLHEPYASLPSPLPTSPPDLVPPRSGSLSSESSVSSSTTSNAGLLKDFDGRGPVRVALNDAEPEGEDDGRAEGKESNKP